MRFPKMIGVATVATLVACVVVAVAQPEGKARLFVEITAKDRPKEEQKLSPELQALVASGGELVGQTRRGLCVIDVPAAKAEAAKASIGKMEVAAKVLESVANAGQLHNVRRLTIKHTPGKPPSEKELEKIGLKVVRKSGPGSFWLVAADKAISAETIKQIQGIESVAFIQMDRVMSIRPIRNPGVVRAGKANGGLAIAKKASADPYDPFFVDGTLWGLKNANCPKAWQSVTKSPKVVAVIDTGVDYNHSEIQHNVWVNVKERDGKPGVDDDGNGLIDDVYGYDFVNDDGNPMDDNDHGTHCAGTIGAASNTVGVVGVVWDVKIMPLKFLSAGGSGSNADAIFCIDYAIAQGAHIISASWGGYGYDRLLEEAVGRAEKAGILFVAAASNEDNDNDGPFKAYPASLTNGNIISVMAIDRNDVKASFSNYGRTSVHLAAPGVDIMSTIRGGGFDSFNGTSMATPHVAGSAALAWGHPKYSGLSCKDMKQLLFDNGRPIPELKKFCLTGKALNLEFLQP